MENIATVVVAAIVIALSTLLFATWSYRKSCRQKPDPKETAAQLSLSGSVTKEHSRPAPKTKSKPHDRAGHPSKQPPPPELVATLKGFSGTVHDAAFSHSGEFIACVSEDRTLRLFKTKTLAKGTPKFTRVNVEFDHGTRLTWSPDDGNLAVGLYSGDVQVYTVSKGSDDTVSVVAGVKFSPKHKQDLQNVSIHSPTIVTASNERDVTFKVWAFNGDILASIDTKQLRMHEIIASPSGRFIAACTFSSEVKVWEVTKTKLGSYESIAKVMDATKHKKAVHRAAFSHDDTRLATVSEDGTLKLWNIDVRYSMKEDPKVLWSIDSPFSATDCLKMLVSPDNKRLLALAPGVIIVMSMADGAVEGKISLGDLGGQRFSIAHNSKTVVTSGYGKHAHVWKLP